MSRIMMDEVARLLGIPQGFVLELHEAGIVVDDHGFVTEQFVERVRVSWTLHEELGVNLAGIEVALHLLSVIHEDRRGWHAELTKR